MLPFVSLIIPTLNEEKYLEQTILSLLSNDYPSNKFEILLIDGLSKDNTLVIAQRLAKKFPNIRLMSNPKIYQSADESEDLLTLVGTENHGHTVLEFSADIPA